LAHSEISGPIPSPGISVTVCAIEETVLLEVRSLQVSAPPAAA
jgi:hypothetical protein